MPRLTPEYEQAIEKRLKPKAAKERESAQIILTHLGKAARLAHKSAIESDTGGYKYFYDLYRTLEDAYVDIQKKFPGIEEKK